MSIVDNLKNTQVTPKTAAIYIAILLVVVGGIIFVVKNIMMPSQDAAVKTEIENGSAHVKVTLKEDSKKNVPAKTDGSAITAKPVDPCVMIAQRNIFKPVVNPGSANPGSKMVPPITLGVIPSLRGGQFGMPGSMPGSGGGSGPSNVKIAFTGIVETPEGTMALLENTSNNETKYVRVGDTAFGVSVVEVNSSAVSIISEGRNIKLALGENKTSVPPTPPTPSTPPGSPSPGGPPQPGQAMPPGQMPPQAMQAMPQMAPPQGSGGNGGSRGGRRRNGN